jgi:hypothetical protein
LVAAVVALFALAFVMAYRNASDTSLAGSSVNPILLQLDASIISKQQESIFSETGEDGVIRYLFRTIGTTNKYYVEAGTTSGKACNTRYLREREGWQGLMLDGGFENVTINLHKHFLSVDNIASLLHSYSVPQAFDFLSIDIDGVDYYVLEAILKGKFRPRVVVLEYTSAIPMPHTTSTAYSKEFSFDYEFGPVGMSLGASLLLMKKFGYSFVFCTGELINAFFIQSDIVGLADGSHYASTSKCYVDSKYTGLKWSKDPSELNHPVRFVDVASDMPVYYEGIPTGWNGTFVKAMMYLIGKR